MESEDEARFIHGLYKDLAESGRKLSMQRAKMAEYARRLEKAAEQLRDPIAMRASKALSNLPELNDIRKLEADFREELDTKESIEANLELAKPGH